MADDFILRNVSEDLVEMYLDDCIATSSICRCARCRADVLALALNLMPAQYVVSDIGDLFIRASALSNQYRADVVAAITKGIMTVESHPRHGVPREVN